MKRTSCKWSLILNQTGVLKSHFTTILTKDSQYQ